VDTSVHEQNVLVLDIQNNLGHSFWMVKTMDGHLRTTGHDYASRFQRRDWIFNIANVIFLLYCAVFMEVARDLWEIAECSWKEFVFLVLWCFIYKRNARRNWH
jgi:hypothetical protein